MNIEQLNRDFSVANALQFIDGAGSAPLISIKNNSANALISLYGGQVLAFQPNTESQDLMFLSDKADYSDGKAIRGGVPICWPWFGSEPTGAHRLNHGFVRNALWSVAETKQLSEQATKVILRFVQTEASGTLWPHSFELSLEITVGNTLVMELVTQNNGDASMALTEALHSYFHVGDIDQVQVLGLETKHYLDKLDDFQQKQQIGPVTFTEEVDCIYLDVQNPLVIEDVNFNRRIRITSMGSQNAIVWNPWAQNSAAMADLEPQDYRRFVCVEVGNVTPDGVEIEPGAEHRLHTCVEIV